MGKLAQQDETSFTYMGAEARTRRLVTIREFFPMGSTRQGQLIYHKALTAYNEMNRAFRRDAEILLRIRHKGLPRLVAVFEASNTTYCVTEQAPGKSLAAFLQERGPLPEAEAVTLAEKMGRALGAAHHAGLLHRALRPEHTLIKADGEPVLLHFLLGGALPPSLAGPQPSDVKLISRYAAPEQYAAAPQSDAPADVYGLAAMLYHILTGHAPIAATARAKGVALKGPRSLNPQISARVADAIIAGLNMEARQRPQRAALFIEQLKGAPATQPSAPQTDPAGFNFAPFTPPIPAVPKSLTTPSLLPHDLLFTTRPPGTTSSGPPHSLSGQPDAPALFVVPPVPVPFPVTSAFHPTSATVHKLSGHMSRVASVAFSPVGGLLASGDEAGLILLWEARTGKLLRALPEALAQTLLGTVTEAMPRSLNETLTLAKTMRHSVQSKIKGDSKRISAVDFSPDGRTLACGNEDSTVTLWNSQTGKLQRMLSGHVGRVTAVAFSPTGDSLASASSDSTAILWNTLQGTPMQTWSDHGTGVNSVAFSDDGRLLATGSHDSGILVWDMRNGQQLHTLTAPDHEVTTLAFSPDGRLLASGSYDKNIILWDIATATPLWTLTGHTGGITAVAFAPDGHLLASGSYDKTVRLWDALTGEVVITLSDHAASVNAVAFAPDGKTLATGLFQEVWLWRFS